MPVVKLPNGTYVTVPDDISEKELAQLALENSPPQVRDPVYNAITAALPMAKEAGKGAARGFVGVGTLIGKGLAPAPGTIAGYDISMPRSPEMEQLKGMFDQAMAPNYQDGWDKAAGIAGEIGGGMMFPGLGMFSGAAKAGLKGLEQGAPSAIRPAMQRIEPYLDEALEPAVKAAAPVVPAPNQYAIPLRTAKDLLATDRTIAAVPIPKKVPEKPPPQPPPFPPKTDTVPPTEFTSPKQALDYAISSFPSWGKHALDALMYAGHVPYGSRILMRGLYGLAGKMASGSEPAKALAPKTVLPQGARRWSQGAVTQLPEDD